MKVGKIWSCKLANANGTDDDRDPTPHLEDRMDQAVASYPYLGGEEDELLLVAGEFLDGRQSQSALSAVGKVEPGTVADQQLAVEKNLAARHGHRTEVE